MATLTKEQRERMEANRLLALERRREKQVISKQNIQQKSYQDPQQKSNQNLQQKSYQDPQQKSNQNLQQKSNLNFQQKSNLNLQEKSNLQSSSSTSNSKPFGKQIGSTSSSSFRKVVSGNCNLLSKERFSVVVPFHAQLIEVFKSLESKLYDAKERSWNFKLDDHDLLMSRLKSLKEEVTIEPLPDYVLKMFRSGIKGHDNYKDADLSRIDQSLVESLMPFQKDGICFGILKKGRCLLADDMGLGKTIQALGIAHYYRDDWPLLIVCPSSVRYLWADSIISWLPSVPYHSVVVLTSSKDLIGEADIVITSYDLMSRCQKELQQISFGVCIMDESHFLKSSKSARTKAGSKIMENARRVIMLSGTPALSRPIELYPQISAICPKLFPSFFVFGKRYCGGVQNKFGWDFSGSSNMVELQLVLEQQLMIRRLKSDVISQLPEKLRQMVILNPELVVDKSREMKSCLKKLGEEHLTGMERRGALLTYYCATGTAKLKAIQDYISDLLDSGKKFLCFAHHKVVMDGICDIISCKNQEYIRIDGSTESNMRKILCDKFQYEDKYVVAVLSITAANAGITLTAAHLVVFAELYWNPGILTQAEDRAHRIGQQDSVLVQYLVAKGTADDHLWPLIQNKLNVLNKAGLSKDNFLDTETTVVQGKRASSSYQPSILNYFMEISSLDDELSNDLLANIDLDEYEFDEKRRKVDD